ncbi:FG-GAP repeat domain-containing protein [Streptomyces sp. NPDC057280]|uniref:FG-GAP repeat domain-containing protein n=1 Tax=Streptomyces sp. NPDC057280 TaxID=3346081 RepID=UPI0036436F3F
MSLPSHRTRRALVVAITLIAATCGALPVAQAAPPAAGARQDFNGDGYEDLAVAAPHATVGGKAKAGYVAVLSGSASGLRTSSKKVYSQASAGIPGTPEAGDLFGSRLAAADLDGDGYTDLLVESLGEQWQQDGVEHSGTRTVLWGGPAGLTSGTVLPAEGTGRLQAPLTVAGDFDGDGHQDLARDGRVLLGPLGRDGRPAATQENAPFTDADLLIVAVATGDTDGDGTDDLAIIAREHDWDSETDYGNYVYYAHGSREGLRPGAQLTALALRRQDAIALGDLDGDGRADLVLGENNLRVVRAGRQGLPDTAPRVITQDTPGVPGAQETGDDFGWTVSIGDTDGDGYGDILAGIPEEDFGGLKNAGTFAVVPGGPRGATGAGAKVLSQNTPGVPGTAENGDRFGLNATLVDGNGDGKAEPVVASVAENSFAGGVWVFPGGATAKGSFTFGARTLGTVASGARLGDQFPR